MGRSSLAVEEIDRLVAKALEDARLSQGISFRQLAKESGVSATRLHALLNAERPITVGELDDIAESLSLVGWEVHRDAEEALHRHAPARILSAVDDNLDSEEFLSEPYAANQPGYSPRDEQAPEST